MQRFNYPTWREDEQTRQDDLLRGLTFMADSTLERMRRKQARFDGRENVFQLVQLDALSSRLTYPNFMKDVHVPHQRCFNLLQP